MLIAAYKLKSVKFSPVPKPNEKMENIVK